MYVFNDEVYGLNGCGRRELADIFFKYEKCLEPEIRVTYVGGK